MTNNWKIGFFSLLALLIIGVNIFVWFFWGKNLIDSVKTTPIPTPTITSGIKPTPTINPAGEENLIKRAVYEKTGLDESEALVTINKNTGLFATGGIKEYEAVSGAYWLAAKTTTGWVCVYDGQSHPTCDQIAPYNFPKDMVPECLDKNGQVVKR